MSPAGPDPDAFAALLCDWCLQPEERDQVLISTTPEALPLVGGLNRALLDRRAWPLLRLAPGALVEDFYRHAADIHLDEVPPLELDEARGADTFLSIDAPANTRALADVDPGQIARVARARSPLREVRLAKRWCGTIWPTAALAQQAAMGGSDYASFVQRAMFLDQADPVAAWQRLSEHQAELVGHLARAREIRIEAEGTDLRLRVDGRTWINSDGRRNMPSGEVFTGPIEHSAQGTVRFTIPSSRGGAEVADVELRLRDGEVTDAHARVGADFLRASLAIDAGARYLGELGIGTNPGIDRATGSTLLDEKISRTVHLALGRSYPETGATNASALHWDLICDLRDGGRVSADGEVLNDFLWGV